MSKRGYESHRMKPIINGRKLMGLLLLSRGGASGNKLKITLSCPVYVVLSSP